VRSALVTHILATLAEGGELDDCGPRSNKDGDHAAAAIECLGIDGGVIGAASIHRVAKMRGIRGGKLNGRADVLSRIESLPGLVSCLGVADIELARERKGSSVLQIAFDCDLLLGIKACSRSSGLRPAAISFRRSARPTTWQPTTARQEQARTFSRAVAETYPTCGTADVC